MQLPACVADDSKDFCYLLWVFEWLRYLEYWSVLQPGQPIWMMCLKNGSHVTVYQLFYSYVPLRIVDGANELDD